jgi:thiamine biosynthesis lipoprotein
LFSVFTVYPFLYAIASSAAEPLQRFETTSVHMGTEWRIALYAKDKPTAEKASKAAFARVAELERVMSDYKNDSELMKLCLANDGNPGEPRKVSTDLFDVLEKAQRIAAASEGAFDPTIGPVVKLWRTARKTKQIPDAKELAAAKELVGHSMMKPDAKERSVAMAKAGMRLDLGGIGKGYAADAVLKVLKGQGIASALVAASGDITVSDAPPGKPGWVVEIAPLEKAEAPRRLLLANASVSTSGDLFQFVEIAGVRYSHVLDPKTGLGLTGRRSATVIAREGWLADSLTKAASVMPPEVAVKVVERFGAAMFVAVKDNDDAKVFVKQSKNFADYEAK